MKSKDSSKEDDIQAICEMRGAGRNAPLALQLKAIDEEYHYLLDQGQSDRVDYVQKLYAWKSKQATQVKQATQRSSLSKQRTSVMMIPHSILSRFDPKNSILMTLLALQRSV